MVLKLERVHESWNVFESPVDERTSFVELLGPVKANESCDQDRRDADGAGSTMFITASVADKESVRRANID
jgi:hypothetical protein